MTLSSRLINFSFIAILSQQILSWSSGPVWATQEPSALSANPRPPAPKPKTETPRSSPSIVEQTLPSSSSNVIGYKAAVHRLSLGFELGGGANLSTAVGQGYGEGSVSLGIDIYDSCYRNPTKTCFIVYALAPVLSGGDYTRSQLGFFQVGAGPGFRLIVKQWIGILFEGGFAIKFSPIPSRAEQSTSPIPSLFLRDPNDSILPVGWFQAGISLDLSRKLNISAARRLWLQAAFKIADAPSNGSYKTIDLALMFGVRWYFMK